jgi:hypothetical protein
MDERVNNNIMRETGPWVWGAMSTFEPFEFPE